MMGQLNTYAKKCDMIYMYVLNTRKILRRCLVLVRSLISGMLHITHRRADRTEGR
jgi:hypothetical protein